MPLAAKQMAISSSPSFAFESTFWKRYILEQKKKFGEKKKSEIWREKNGKWQFCTKLRKIAEKFCNLINRPEICWQILKFWNLLTNFKICFEGLNNRRKKVSLWSMKFLNCSGKFREILQKKFGSRKKNYFSNYGPVQAFTSLFISSTLKQYVEKTFEITPSNTLL